MQEAIRSSPGTPLDLTIERNGATRDVTVTPIANTVYVDAQSARDHHRRVRGRQPGHGFARQDGSAVPGYFGMVVVQLRGGLVQIPERVPQLFRAAFLGEERDPNGPIGVVGVGRISGEAFALPSCRAWRSSASCSACWPA